MYTSYPKKNIDMYPSHMAIIYDMHHNISSPSIGLVTFRIHHFCVHASLFHKPLYIFWGLGGIKKKQYELSIGEDPQNAEPAPWARP